jgi:methyl-accepting chemotaxis protein
MEGAHMNIATMKVGTRLGIGFGLVLVMLAALALTGLMAFSSIAALNKKIVEQDIVKADAANAINATTGDNAKKTMLLFLIADKTEAGKIGSQIAANKKTIDDAVVLLDKMIALPEGKALLAKIKEARGRYVVSFESVHKLLDEDKHDEAAKIMTSETLPLLDTLQANTKALAEFQKKLVDSDSDLIGQRISSASSMITAFSLLALLLGIAAALFIMRGLLKQLGGEPDYAAGIASQIASGNLAVAVDVKANDHTSLLFAIKSMRDSLANIVGEVRAGTEVISVASRQIATGNQDLSSRTEEQASSLEETASSMEELTSTVKQNADNARQADTLAHSASETAKKGGAVVAQVVETMNAINESSRKIVDIISVIDGIAFQTNILALNAAVEAARAGEQGRGFAVVASEVRNLAQRSAAAAKEIKVLINNSVETVAGGTKLVGDAGETMEELLTSVRHVTDIMGEISAASREQTSGIEQINLAVTQMDQVTQQNAALVEEAAAAAEAMQERAEELARVVSVFTLDAAHTGAARAAAQAGDVRAIPLKSTQRPKLALA